MGDIVYACSPPLDEENQHHSKEEWEEEECVREREKVGAQNDNHTTSNLQILLNSVIFFSVPLWFFKSVLITNFQKWFEKRLDACWKYFQ